MALGYLSKALRRAEPALGTASLRLRPAARTGSPLADEDQRLHVAPEVTAPTVHVSPPTDAPAPTAAAMPSQETEIAPPPLSDPINEQSAPAPSPVTPLPTMSAPDTSDGLKRQASLEEPETPEVVSSLPGVAPTGDQPVFETEADVDSWQSEPPVAPTTADPLTRALAVAEKWVASNPPDDTELRSPDTEDERFDSVTGKSSVKRAPMPDVEPIIRTQTDMRGHSPEPPAPTVDIGSIEIEILPPPPAQTPKPVQRSAPAKAPSPGVAPFGWRQR